MSAPIPAGRADTPAAKREILARLLAAWERVPEQRLGQLLDNALNQESLAGAGALFTIEDEPLVAALERFAPPGGA